MTENINQGTRVQFDDPECGPQIGTVRNLKLSIENGLKVAEIEVDHGLPGCIWNVPLDDLRCISL